MPKSQDTVDPMVYDICNFKPVIIEWVSHILKKKDCNYDWKYSIFAEIVNIPDQSCLKEMIHKDV